MDQLKCNRPNKAIWNAGNFKVEVAGLAPNKGVCWVSGEYVILGAFLDFPKALEKISKAIL